MRTGYVKYLGSAILLAVLIAAVIPPESAEFSSRNDKITLKLETEHEKYYVKQDLWVKVTLSNHSDSDFVFLKTYDVNDGIEFNLINQLGEEYCKSRLICRIIEIGTDTLKPGEKITVIGRPENCDGSGLREGNYTLQGHFNKLSSNVCKIKVKKPVSVDKKVQSELGIYRANQIKKDVDANFELWKSIWKYPGTVYESKIYEYIMMDFPFKPYYIIENVYMSEFMNKHCESYNSRMIVLMYFLYLKNWEKMDRKGIDERLSYWAESTKGVIRQQSNRRDETGVFKGA